VIVTAHQLWHRRGEEGEEGAGEDGDGDGGDGGDVSVVVVVVGGGGGGGGEGGGSKGDGTSYAPHRPSTPTAPLLNLHRLHLGIPSDHNPISQSLSSGGTPVWRARAESGRVRAGKCYSAELERTRKTNVQTAFKSRRCDVGRTGIIGCKTARCSWESSAEQRGKRKMGRDLSVDERAECELFSIFFCGLHG
jgi:hypothetical protein